MCVPRQRALDLLLREVTVPGVVTQASWDVGDSCTSMQAMSDGWNYDILNCEVGQD